VVVSNQTPISDDTGQRSYYCVAQNDFGVSFSKQVDIHGMLLNIVLELEIVSNKCWVLVQFQTVSKKNVLLGCLKTYSLRQFKR